MPRLKTQKKIISATDAVRLAFGAKHFFTEQYVPSEILHENRLLHLQLGADNTEEVELELPNGWLVKGVPDKILEDGVVEVKIQRPLSRAKELIVEAAYQGLIYATALGFEKVEVWLLNYTSGEVTTYNFTPQDLKEVQFFQALQHNLGLIEQMKSYYSTAQQITPTSQGENKLAMKRVKHID